jgi:hypothetical protein
MATARRATIDADELHEQRLEQARQDLQAWARWVIQRTDGGLGFGQGCLANLGRVSRSADGYQAPINEVTCSKTDDIVRSLGRESHQIAVAHFARGYSTDFIARSRRMAWATVKRRIEEVIRAVAYPSAAPTRQQDRVM